MSEEQVTAELERLDAMGLAELRGEWSRRFGYTPKLRSVELLRLNLAWRVQEAAFGGLDGHSRLRLRRSGAPGRGGDVLTPGTRLIREWKGTRHEVEVVAQGYLYAGQSWASLSQIARQITGSRWNGPRFFGLRGGAEEVAA